jgi:hypothetical protein
VKTQFFAGLVIMQPDGKNLEPIGGTSAAAPLWASPDGQNLLKALSGPSPKPPRPPKPSGKSSKSAAKKKKK